MNHGPDGIKMSFGRTKIETKMVLTFHSGGGGRVPQLGYHHRKVLFLSHHQMCFCWTFSYHLGGQFHMGEASPWVPLFSLQQRWTGTRVQHWHNTGLGLRSYSCRTGLIKPQSEGQMWGLGKAFTHVSRDLLLCCSTAPFASQSVARDALGSGVFLGILLYSLLGSQMRDAAAQSIPGARLACKWSGPAAEQ